MPKGKIVLIAAVCLLSAAGPAFAVNSIVVESRTFVPGELVCSVGVYLTNDIAINGLVLVLELRTLNGGAYIKAPPTPLQANFFNRQPGCRLDRSPLGSADPGGAWPAALMSLRFYEEPSTLHSCTGPPSHTWYTAVSSLSGTSPDGILYSCIANDQGSGDPLVLPAGADPPRRDSASWLFRFGVNMSSGCFEIDSACDAPSGHLALTYEEEGVPYAIAPAFTKGLICIEGQAANQPPELGCPSEVTAQAPTGQAGVSVSYSVSVIDEDPALVPDCQPPSGSFFPIGSTLVTCTVTDTGGLADTCEFNVIVTPAEENQAPVLSCPSVVWKGVPVGASGGFVTYSVTVTDEDQSLVAVCDPPSGSFFPLGITGVFCTVADTFGLADTCEFEVKVAHGGANAVIVESRTFLPGQTACSVGVFLHNLDAINGLVLALELRSMSGGAFYKGPAGASFFQAVPGGRLDASPLGTADPSGQWPQAYITRRLFNAPEQAVPCGGAAGYSWNVSTGSVGGTSPDAVEYATVSSGDAAQGDLVSLPPAADLPYTSGASFLFLFDADTLEGCFEIDTTCVKPSGHLVFVFADGGGTQAIAPIFTKGTICINDCICQCHGNPAVCANPAVDLLDVVYAINGIFRAGGDIPDPHPACSVSTLDVDCDGAPTVVDVVTMIDVAFRGISRAVAFCNPCP